MPVAVFDCMMWVQAASRPLGPARRCFEMVEQGRATLVLDDLCLTEIGEVLRRVSVQRKLPTLDPQWVDQFLDRVRARWRLLQGVPKVLALPRDPKDEPYVDLAIAGGADYLVTWNDRHLTYLMRQDTPEGREFCQRFPKLKIVDPPTFLRAVQPPAPSAE